MNCHLLYSIAFQKNVIITANPTFVFGEGPVQVTFKTTF